MALYSYPTELCKAIAQKARAAITGSAAEASSAASAFDAAWSMVEAQFDPGERAGLKGRPSARRDVEACPAQCLTSPREERPARWHFNQTESAK
jgi:hypothetical protein